jgi:hypothetical protein
MLDIYTYRSQLWESANNTTSLNHKAVSLFNWLENKLRKDICEQTVADKIVGFKKEYLALNESSVDNLHKIEDDLIDKIDEIIEKMIYAVYAELQRLQQQQQQYQQTPQQPAYGVHDYEMPYYHPPRRKRKSWFEKMFDSVKPYGDLINEESAHPVIKIIQLISKFGSDAKKLVRQSVRNLNQQIGVPSPQSAKTDNGLGSFSLNTNDLNKSFNTPTMGQQASSDVAAPTPLVNKPNASMNPSSSPTTGAMRDPRQTVAASPTMAKPTMPEPVMNKPSSVPSPMAPQAATPSEVMPKAAKLPTEAQLAIGRIADGLKGEKDYNKFIEELSKFRRPVTRMAAILRKITGQEIPKTANEKVLMDIAEKWHKMNHGLSATFNPVTPEPPSTGVAKELPKKPNIIPPGTGTGMAKELPRPMSPKVTIPNVPPAEPNSGIAKEAPVPNKPLAPVVKRSPEEIENELNKVSKVNPSIIFRSSLKKALEEIPGFNIDDYEPSALSKAYTKSVGDTAKETADNFINMIQSGKLNKKEPSALAPTPKPEAPKPTPEPEPKPEEEKPSVDDLFGPSEETPSDQGASVLSPDLEPDSGDYSGMGRNFGGKSHDISNTSTLTPDDLARKERARKRAEKMGFKSRAMGEMTIQEKVQYYKDLLRSRS